MKRTLDQISAASSTAAGRAMDFIRNETQFHLGFLPTEQPNPITATLEDDFRRSTLAGVQCLQRGDRQIPIAMRHVFAGHGYKALVSSFVETLRSPRGRIVFSGCGATGRLSILLESMWRDFFHRHGGELTPEDRSLADRVFSIMTGGDFALVKSVESFEDYAGVGRLQAEALAVGEGDAFVAITEGGETSSVLGSLAFAVERGARCFLVFNNPAQILRDHLERCRKAIDDPRVEVIDLYCGSMSLAGSTRMQATTSEQLLCSCALEEALGRMLPAFAPESSGDATAAFESVLAGLESPGGRAGLVAAIEFEKAVYERHGRVTYLADRCMLDLFTDNTERSPTFMLPPLRPRGENSLPESWAFVKNPLFPTRECWGNMLRREPRCLDLSPDDLRALGMPSRIVDNPPKISLRDLLSYEIGNEPAPERIKGFPRAVAIGVTVGDKPPAFRAAATRLASAWPERTELHIGPCPTDGIWIDMPVASSPLEIWKHLAVKRAFNCISTGTMTALGRVAGNWMSWVSISNKKLVDRGIRLLSELGRIGYEDAALRLFEAEEWVAAQDWIGREEPCAVQVALGRIRDSRCP